MLMHTVRDIDHLSSALAIFDPLIGRTWPVTRQ
jgi:hypothetical protein